jgi:hypothetical protein
MSESGSYNGSSFDSPISDLCQEHVGIALPLLGRELAEELDRGVEVSQVPVQMMRRLESAWEGYESTKRLVEWYMVGTPGAGHSVLYIFLDEDMLTHYRLG